MEWKSTYVDFSITDFMAKRRTGVTVILQNGTCLEFPDAQCVNRIMDGPYEIRKAAKVLDPDKNFLGWVPGDAVIQIHWFE